MAPTAPPRASARSSTGLKSPSVPRPPTTTTCASPRSGRPEAARAVRSRSCTPSVSAVTAGCVTTSGLVGTSAGTTGTALGLSATTARGAVTRLRSVQVAANACWTVTTPPSGPASTSEASTTRPAPSAKARRAAISLFSKVDDSSTEPAPVASATAASAAEVVTTTAAPSRATWCTTLTPCSPSVPGTAESPSQTPCTGPRRRATVSSSSTGVRRLPSWWSRRTRTGAAAVVDSVIGASPQVGQAVGRAARLRRDGSRRGTRRAAARRRPRRSGAPGSRGPAGRSPRGPRCAHRPGPRRTGRAPGPPGTRW